MWYRRNVNHPEVNPVLKYILFIFSTIYWLLGLGLILIGIYACIEKGLVISDFSNLITDPAIVILCVGSGLFGLTFFACVGALRENICMLQFFSCVLAISLFIQVISGFLIILLANQVEQVVENYFLVVIESYRDDPDTQNIVDWGQQEFKCCGAKEKVDWSRNKYFNCSLSNPSLERCSVPWSCCIKDESQDVVNTLCGIGVLKLDNIDAGETIYTDGCVEALTVWIHDHLFFLACLAVGLAIPQIIGVCISRILLLQIKDQLLYMKLSGLTSSDL